MRFLLANQVNTKEDKDRILLLKKGGLLVRQIIRVVELEKGVKHGDLPFLKKDIHNLYVKMRRMHAMNDAMGLFQFEKLLRKRNLNFNMHIQLIKRVGWSIFFGHLLLVLISTKNMEMWLFFILLTKYMHMTCLMVFFLVSIIIERQFFLVMHFFEMKQLVHFNG